jgi:hypothetical protein
MSLIQIVASEYWRISQAIHGRSHDVVSAQEAVEFLIIHAQCAYPGLSKACVSTLQGRYCNVPLSTAFSEGA